MVSMYEISGSGSSLSSDDWNFDVAIVRFLVDADDLDLFSSVDLAYKSNTLEDDLHSGQSESACPCQRSQI